MSPASAGLLARLTRLHLAASLFLLQALAAVAVKDGNGLSLRAQLASLDDSLPLIPDDASPVGSGTLVSAGVSLIAPHALDATQSKASGEASWWSLFPAEEKRAKQGQHARRGSGSLVNTGASKRVIGGASKVASRSVPHTSSLDHREVEAQPTVEEMSEDHHQHPLPHASKDSPTMRANVPEDANQVEVNRLYDDLFGTASGYRSYLRPVRTCPTSEVDPLCSTRIEAQLAVSFRQLVHVSEKENTVKMLAVYTLSWPDYRLKYNASQYFSASRLRWNHGEDFVSLDKSRLWIPDIQLANAAEPIEPTFEPRLYLYDEEELEKSGFNVRMHMPVVVNVKCNFDLRQFPFDKQICPFAFRAWSANTNWLTLKAEGCHSQCMENFQTWEESQAQEFNVTAITIQEGETRSIDDRSEKFSQVVYSISLSRYSHYYISNVVLPMLLVVVLSIGVFYIDPPRGERMGYSSIMVLTVMTISYFTAELVPKNGGGETWLEHFQAVCYIITIIPIIASIICELACRCVRGRRHKDHANTEWVTDRCDTFLRPPYSVGASAFLYFTTQRILPQSGNAEPSVLMVITFFYTCITIFAALGVGEVLWHIYRVRVKGEAFFNDGGSVDPFHDGKPEDAP